MRDSPGIAYKRGDGTNGVAKIKINKRIEVCLYDDDGKLDNEGGTRRHVIVEEQREGTGRTTRAATTTTRATTTTHGGTVHGITHTPRREML